MLVNDIIKAPHVETVLCAKLMEHKNLESAILETSLSLGITYEDVAKVIMESAPPCPKAEKFIKSAKKSFKKRYGKRWKQVLYATAWKKFSKC